MERTFNTPKPVRLVVENESGLVTVHAVAGVAGTTTTVSVTAETPGAEELVERTTVECRPLGDTHTVVVKVPRQHGMRFLRRHAVNVRVEVPEGSDVELATAAADIEVTGTVGAADITTASGDVSTDDIADGLRATTASGNVIVGTVTGKLRMRSASGDLRCTRATGRVDCASTSGDVEIGAADGTVEVHATSGNVRLGELHRGAKVANVSGNVRVLSLGEGKLFVRSVSGDVAVGVPAGVDLFLDVSTMGSFRSDIPIDDMPAPGGSRVKVDLSVSTVSGNVEIERALEHMA
jgi:hypothetical protein